MTENTIDTDQRRGAFSGAYLLQFLINHVIVSQVVTNGKVTGEEIRLEAQVYYRHSRIAYGIGFESVTDASKWCEEMAEIHFKRIRKPGA